MAKNKDLYSIGKETMIKILSQNGIPPSEMEKAKLIIDEQYKIRLHLGNLIFYAYDFRGGDAKELFEKAINNTRKVPTSSMNLEHLITSGTIAKIDNFEEDIIGWYLTQV